jgi:ribose 1,5-bisphosphokinase
MAGPPAEKIGPGALVLVVGPSGAGKDTLLGVAREMLGDHSGIVFARRAVTRESTAFENNEPVTREQFDRAVAAGAYALWWRAHGHGYGIARTIDDEIGASRVVVVNASRTIVDVARGRYQRLAVVLITAPAEVLAERLKTRRRDSDGDLAGRLQRASLDTGSEPDLVISNIGAVENGARQLADFVARLGK